MDARRDLPRKFGRYVLFDLVGQGGMAELFLAREHISLGATRLVVVKQVLPELSHHQPFAELLISEAKLAARLNHANVVHVLDLGRQEDRLYIAMEYVEGFDLNELLRQCSRAKAPLPLEFIFWILIETLRGLDYAHRSRDERGKPLGIVHRDVSPSNVLISFEGEVKLCDFGIAHANNFANQIFTETIQGKAAYMSPEQARGKPLDARADVFAAGIILWELLAGRRRYKASKDVNLLKLAQIADYNEFPELGLPSENQLRMIVRQALSANRDARYPSAQAMLRDLESYAADASLLTSPLRLGAWMRETFGQERIERRRDLERSLQQAEQMQPDVGAQPPMSARFLSERSPSLPERSQKNEAAKAKDFRVFFASNVNEIRWFGLCLVGFSLEFWFSLVSPSLLSWTLVWLMHMGALVYFAFFRPTL